jgi:hypothetical protein
MAPATGGTTPEQLRNELRARGCRTETVFCSASVRVAAGTGTLESAAAIMMIALQKKDLVLLTESFEESVRGCCSQGFTSRTTVWFLDSELQEQPGYYLREI